MNTQMPKHLITELGVLKTFSIGKKLSSVKIKNCLSKMDKTNKTKEESENFLKHLIAKEAEKIINTTTVPGIVVDKISNKRQMTEKKLVDLTYFASIINKKVSEKGMEKFDKCYLINVLVNMLGLDEADFCHFHQTFHRFKMGEIEDPGDNDNLPFF